jgi:hypothetical protein
MRNQLTALPDLPNCWDLNCPENLLTTLPDLPKCEVLTCNGNRLTSLPNLPNCLEVNCHNNQLISIPSLPIGQWLLCHNNRLTSLPDLPHCEKLWCFNNQLTSLPSLPKCMDLDCQSNQLTFLPDLSHYFGSIDHSTLYRVNPLPFREFSKWRRVWRVRKLLLGIKYSRLWYKRMLRAKGEKKKTLHLELLWSPKTKFYQQTAEYQHFLDNQKIS